MTSVFLLGYFEVHGVNSVRDNWVDIYAVAAIVPCHQYLRVFHWMLCQFSSAPISLAPQVMRGRSISFLSFLITSIMGALLGKISSKFNKRDDAAA